MIKIPRRSRRTDRAGSVRRKVTEREKPHMEERLSYLVDICIVVGISTRPSYIIPNDAALTGELR